MDPQDQAKLNKLYQEYIDLLQKSNGYSKTEATTMADIAKSAGRLEKEIKKVNNELNEVLFRSDYLYESFKETTAELKKQNVYLQQGKATFKGLTSIASDLTYFQQGITDLSVKQFKNHEKTLKKETEELAKLKNKLSINGEEYNRQKQLNELIEAKRNSLDGLTKVQSKLLQQLQSEKALFDATKNALDEELPILEKELEISKQIYKVREDVGGLTKAAAESLSKFSGDLSEFLNIGGAIEDVNKFTKDLVDDALKDKEVLDQIAVLEAQRNSILRGTINLQQEINKLNQEIKDSIKAEDEQRANNNELAAIAIQLQEKQNKLSTLINPGEEDERIEVETEIANLRTKQNELNDENNRLQAIAIKKDQAKLDLGIKEEELKQRELSDAKTLQKLSEDEQKIKQDAIESINKGGQGLLNKFKALGVLLKGFGSGFLKSLTDPAVILNFILDRADKFNRASVDISKNFGYSADKADRVAQSVADVANNSANLNVTFKNAIEAMSQLSEATGFVQQYSADALNTQVMLTKQFGLTGEEAAGIYKYSVLTGKSSEKINDEMVGAFVAARNQLKVGLPFKQTMAEAAKVSGQLAANLKNDPVGIVKAVAVAKALGTTLEQTKSQGESLLNFESSIENELKAELLTGQQINLERARAAALAGDQVTVAQELANQGMTLAKFQGMNVLAQKSFAEALGLSSDQLAEQLKKQKLAVESGKSLAELNKEDAIKAEKRQATQDKFNAAIEKLQDFFGNLVAGPVAQLLDLLSNALNLINFILTPIKLLFDLTKGIGSAIGGWLDNLGIVGNVLKVVAGIAIVLAAYAAYASLAGIPVVGPVLGGIAATAITAGGFAMLNSQKAGDMISPADGRTQVSTKEGGLFELSKNDDLIAGPGIASNINNASIINSGGNSTITPTIDLTPMIAAINEVKAAINTLANRPIHIMMDSTKVGTGLIKSSYKIS
jgi:hypothetical protein